MAAASQARVSRRRARLRAAGFRPVQIWVPDTRAPGFAAECRRQAVRIAKADLVDEGLGAFLDAAFDDIAAEMGDDAEDNAA